MFDIGDFAKCVYDFGYHPSVKKFGYVVPVVGTIYVVRDIFYSPFGGDPGLFLDEIRNPPVPTIIGQVELSFHNRGFVPIRSEQLDVFRSVENDREKELELVE